ncbi:hypothetical protein ACF07T_39955 [Streptomyces sp. NPDC015184]|uniref:hypothetical protein n=1 Tax=Streptomyces sp. NPDC015184 TaxID=3364946 RepID=UPI0036F7594E
MPVPRFGRPDRPGRRFLPYPGDAAIEAARRRAYAAFALLFTVLGAGRHRLSYGALDVDGCYVTTSATVEITTAPVWRLATNPDAFARMEAALTAALEGSCVSLATLVVESEREPCPVVCGWRIESGWFSGMHPEVVQAAVLPCTDDLPSGVRAYPAPVLPDPSVDEAEPPYRFSGQ